MAASKNIAACSEDNLRFRLGKLSASNLKLKSSLCALLGFDELELQALRSGRGLRRSPGFMGGLGVFVCFFWGRGGRGLGSRAFSGLGFGEMEVMHHFYQE